MRCEIIAANDVVSQLRNERERFRSQSSRFQKKEANETKHEVVMQKNLAAPDSPPPMHLHMIPPPHTFAYIPLSCG